MSKPLESQSPKEKAMSFLQLVASGEVREAYEKYIGPDFRHHNAYFKGDAASLMLAMEENAVEAPNKVIEIKIALQEANKVAVYSHVKQNPEDLGGAVVHFFLFENNHIIEMWDIGQPVPEESINENGMF